MLRVAAPALHVAVTVYPCPLSLGVQVYVKYLISLPSSACVKVVAAAPPVVPCGSAAVGGGLERQDEDDGECFRR